MRLAAFGALLAAAAALAGPFADYRGQGPGRRRRISASDLPEPSADSPDNGPALIARPKDAWPLAPKGFKVTLYASGLDQPRQLRRAPNGDIFVVESRAGRVRVLRGPGGGAVFAEGLDRPFGVAFYPPGKSPAFVYVAETGRVIRYPYKNGDLKPRGPAEKIADVPGGGNVDGGHWTRDVAFSRDGRRLFVSVGSFSNVNDPDEHPEERERACILEFAPDGSGRRIYASGLRNPVGLAVDPKTGALWASVNERDRLGDDLPPDYVTRVKDGGFYGWPWFYTGGRPDPRHRGKHPELRRKVLLPDVLIQPHNAPLGIAFDGRGDLFAAQHGSWNRTVRTGYEVIRVPLKNGVPDGSYEDFLTGFVTADGRVWGRPVGVAFAADGAMLVSDDASGSIWRVAPVKASPGS